MALASELELGYVTMSQMESRLLALQGHSSGKSALLSL